MWHVYAAILLRATGSAVHSPTVLSTTPLMVPKEHLTRVAGIGSAREGIVGLVAPALGALVAMAVLRQSIPAVITLEDAPMD